MKNYYVEGLGWFVITADNKRQAKSVGVREFGRGCTRLVREASGVEVRDYVSQRGDKSLLDWK